MATAMKSSGEIALVELDIVKAFRYSDGRGEHMGTDIHSIAQVKRDGQWVTVAIGIAGDQRNYNTFAMLANVRNGRGFAGCWTSTGFPVIHEPRGLPKDLAAVDDFVENDEDDNPDPSVRVDKAQLVAAWDWSGFETSINNPEARRVRWLKDSSRMDLGDHSRSWCTLAELRAFIGNIAKKTETFIVGVVTREQYEEHQRTGKHYESWCGMVSGQGVYVAGRVGSGAEPLPDFYTHVQTNWPVNAFDESQLGDIEKALTLVAERTSAQPEDLRFVYGFDS